MISKRQTTADGARSPSEDPAELREQFRRVVRAKEEWEAAVDAVTDLVFLTDREGCVLRCNLAAREMIGSGFEAILGRPLEALLGARLGSAVLRLDAETGEIRVHDSGATLRYSRFPASRGGRRFGFVFVLRDVTELLHLQSVATQVDMMNNLGHVLSGVRHEIGNPTNAMKTALTVMAESLGEFSQEKMLSYVQRCLSDVLRIEGLLEQLRTFSLFEVFCHPRVDLGEFLESRVPAIRDGLTAQGIELGLSLPPRPDGEPVVATCDPRALYQVLLGLVSNASEAISGRGGPGSIRLELSAWDGYAQLAVCDDGPGIAPEILDKVVLPLFTTKASGTGLGLTIAHQLLTRMGGRLEIGADPDLGGARIVVLLRR